MGQQRKVTSVTKTMQLAPVCKEVGDQKSFMLRSGPAGAARRRDDKFAHPSRLVKGVSKCEPLTSTLFLCTPSLVSQLDQPYSHWDPAGPRLSTGPAKTDPTTYSDPVSEVKVHEKR